MKKTYFLLISLLAFSSLFAQETPYSFVENKGQWADSHHYRADIPGGYLFLNGASLSYAFYDAEAVNHMHHGGHDDHDHAVAHKSAPIEEREDKIKAHAFHVRFKNANQTTSFSTSGAQHIKRNYFLGKDQRKWASEVPSFAEVTYEELYPSIDLRFYQNELDLKYEFIVGAGTDPSTIQMEYDGVVQIKLFNEHLYIQTSINTLIEQKPYSYQEINGKKVEVASRFVVEGTTVQFEFPNGYDPAFELVIDPVLMFSTFSGSVSDNWGNTATFDTAGNLYNGGIVFGTDFPVSTGAYDVNFNGEIDVVIQQFDSTGSFVNYATYLGGVEAEIPSSLIVNEFNELVILGSTSSVDFPTTDNAFDSLFNWGSSRTSIIGGISYRFGSDLFVAVLDASGSKLLGSTFVGGSSNEGINDASRSNLTRNYGDEFRGDVITDKQGNIYFASNTQSEDFPVTEGAFQTTNTTSQAAVVVKLNRDVSKLEWSTFLGGDFVDAAYSIKLKENGQVVVAGGTASSNFPTTENAFIKDKNGIGTDGFVSILTPEGDSLITSTFIGTESYDQVFFIDLDAEENVSLFGQTQGDYLVTAGVYSNNNSGQFIHKLTPLLDSTIFSTVVGSGSGSPNICPTAFMVSECSNIYITGWGGTVNDPNGQNSNYIGGTTNNMPLTENAFQSTTDGSDFYLMVLSPDASELLYGTYLGGPNQGGEHVDGGTCRFDKRGIVYHSVCSCQDSGYPTTPGAYATENRSTDGFSTRCNNAAFKFDLSVIEASFETSDPNICTDAIITFTNTSKGGKEYTWEINGEVVSNTSTAFDWVFDEPGNFSVTLTVFDPATCIKVNASANVFVVSPQNFSAGEDKVICEGESVQLTAGGGISYDWLPLTNISDPTSPNPVVTPNKTTEYTVKITNEFGCVADSIIKVTVYPEVQARFQADIMETCDTLQQLRISNLTTGATDWKWQLGDGRVFEGEGPGDIVYDKAGTYQIILEASNPSCYEADTVEVEIADVPSSHFYKNITISPDLTLCDGENIELNASGGAAYFWTPQAGLSNQTIPNPIANPTSTTEYQLRVYNEKGCFYDTSLIITVIPPIEVDFSYSRSGKCAQIPSVELINNTLNDVKYTWLMGNGEVIENEEDFFTYNYPDTGSYTITLVAEVEGCAYSSQQQVLIENVIPPNAFSPNGDGLNDTFEIPSQEAGWTLQVYTRWGDQVFASDNYQNDFGGEDLTESTYLYVLTSPIGVECRGWIKVIR
ncbi:gliding motility-associated C-terminal domain-containing protein [Flammeovirgaceae bacterium SG7u.111]|nr:gliding motility-associated C-terminal domain-containing protein [Flammeovirgaceae bacterium SG7u.132]WPO36780.1 gliding motility-associated C-terminal domain-containing protein [Flammeovirgaceae bacterium SG7u.111]